MSYMYTGLWLLITTKDGNNMVKKFKIYLRISYSAIARRRPG